ncbi:MAG TPA: diaminopimelate decarboxylase [Candidatus Acidoferrales bacterium]|nr:diaminopimelate decarboxylase [Candidatus Acidoferrales bacterium]
MYDRDRALRPPQQVDPTQYTPRFRYRGRHLYCEGVRLERVASRVGTPTYLYSRASIEAAFRQLDGSLGALPHTICYAVKASSNLEILRLLARLGSGFDVVSGGELYRLWYIGVSGRRVVFSGVGKTREEIREALDAGVYLINIESAAELDLLEQEAARRVAKGGRRAPAAIRVNPDVKAGGHPHIATGHHRHKFGVDWAEARRLYLTRRASRWIAWRGISAHIGSQILGLGPFRQALERLAGYVRELARAGVPLEVLDFGGGLGIRYAGEKPPDLARYARTVAGIVRPLGCHLLLEPGRVLVGPAGVLLTRVLYRKHNRGKDFVVVDAAMNDFLRPALYGATHPITNAVRRNPGTLSLRADVVGPVCETGDSFLQNWPLGEVAAGDLLVIWGTGAYGFVSSSNYNSRPRAAEVLVEGDRFRVIRRRESRADLIDLE